MTYKELVTDIAARSGLHTAVINKTLHYLPEALLQMGIGDDVRTPLGVFRMTHTPERPITLPDQKSTAIVPKKTWVKLKPGNQLQVENED